MQISKAFSSIAYASFISITSFAAADIIPPSTPNAYFAPLALVDNHPQCSGWGQTAYEVVFETNNLSFYVQTEGRRDRARVRADGTVTIQHQSCAIIERRGTDPVRIEIPCDDVVVPKPRFSQRDLEQTALALSGRFLACQSPTAFDVLESNWEVIAKQETGTSTYSGSFFEFAEQGCEDTYDAEIPAAAFGYSVAGTFGAHSLYASGYRWRREQDIERALPTHFRVELSKIPLLESNEERTNVIANASAIFFPTVNGNSACLDGLCEVPERLGTNVTLFDPRICK